MDNGTGSTAATRVGELDLTHIKKAIEDYRAHEHPAHEDFYCLNLVSWLGERAHLLVAEIERLRAERDDISQQRDRLRNKLIPKGFGRWNQHCMSCGDERGGPFGHETSECRYKPGMTAAEVAELLPEHRRAEFWELCVERYLTLELETREIPAVTS